MARSLSAIEKDSHINGMSLFIETNTRRLKRFPHNLKVEGYEKIGKNVYGQLFIVGRPVFTPVSSVDVVI